MSAYGLRSGARAAGLVALALAAGACGGAPEPTVPRTVFEPGAGGGADGSREHEVPIPALDRQVGPRAARWIGVSVLRDGVRFSRPARWIVREGSSAPGYGYIRYVSPDAYSFSIYERSDAPSDLWRDIEERFEEDVTASGAKAVGRRVPTATGWNQGRAYTIERAQPQPSRSREILLRSDHRVVLVQIVTQGADLSRLSSELLEVLDRFEVR